MEKLGIKTDSEQQERPKEYDRALLNLWSKYKFLGKPPFKDSPAEQRLKETCEKYYKLMVNDHIARIKGSQDKKRELHNQIALMTIGKQRSEVNTEIAEMLANFASELITGQSISEING
jgi:ribosomal protein S8E